MPCKHDRKTEEAALLYAYGELSAEEEKEFLPHLKKCQICQNTLKSVNLMNAALPTIKAPDELLKQVLPAVEPELKVKEKRSWFKLPLSGFSLRLLTPLGAAAILTVAAFGLYETTNLYSAKAQAERDLDGIYESLYSLDEETDALLDYIESL